MPAHAPLVGGLFCIIFQTTLMYTKIGVSKLPITRLVPGGTGAALDLCNALSVFSGQDSPSWSSARHRRFSTRLWRYSRRVDADLHGSAMFFPASLQALSTGPRICPLPGRRRKRNNPCRFMFPALASTANKRAGRGRCYFWTKHDIDCKRHMPMRPPIPNRKNTRL